MVTTYLWWFWDCFIIGFTTSLIIKCRRVQSGIHVPWSSCVADEYVVHWWPYPNMASNFWPWHIQATLGAAPLAALLLKIYGQRHIWTGAKCCHSYSETVRQTASPPLWKLRPSQAIPVCATTTYAPAPQVAHPCDRWPRPDPGGTGRRIGTGWDPQSSAAWANALSDSPRSPWHLGSIDAATNTEWTRKMRRERMRKWILKVRYLQNQNSQVSFSFHFFHLSSFFFGKKMVCKNHSYSAPIIFPHRLVVG